jgi:site-specific DNA-cytosine methylase
MNTKSMNFGGQWGFQARRFEHGSRRDKIMMIGNGVCPPVIQAAIEELLNREPT